MILSVVVPIYNMEKYLKQCIDSILNQTLCEIEVILVDDGSTDRSTMICDEYAEADSRVKVFHQENTGLVGARKKGVELSSSPYITFVDSDDFIEKESYIHALDSMQEGIDIICFGITRYFENRKPSKAEYSMFAERKYNKADIQREIIPRMIWQEKDKRFGLEPSLCTKIIKKDLLVESYSLLKEQNFYYGEDSAIIYPIVYKAHFMEVKYVSFYYHRHREAGECRPYFQDKDFFHKLYIVYKHLSDYFCEIPELAKQIEQFYMYSVNLRKKAYGNDYEEIGHLFPFDKIEKNQRIVLYGAGRLGKTYYHQLLQIPYCELVLWVDKNYQKYKCYDVSAIEEIENLKYDKIIVAIESEEVAQSIKNYLIGNGVCEQDIVLTCSQEPKQLLLRE